MLEMAFCHRSNSEAVHQALFYWGRDALKDLERDQLLEAVIGLEGLIVPRGPGESTYRFKLHGTALLARFTDSAEACAKDLKTIYDKRSKAAHGVPGEGIVEAAKARSLLGHAILAVMEHGEAGTLDLASKDEIGLQIQRLILKKCPLDAQQE